MKNLNICAQDAYLVLCRKSKIPVGTNWREQGKSQEVALANNGNLGLLLGSKSKIMDVRLCSVLSVLFRTTNNKTVDLYAKGASIGSDWDQMRP